MGKNKVFNVFPLQARPGSEPIAYSTFHLLGSFGGIGVCTQDFVLARQVATG
jgi:hypothetical protein